MTCYFKYIAPKYFPGVSGQIWPTALSCLRIEPPLASRPFGPPSFPRSARLTPSARLLDPVLRAALASGGSACSPSPPRWAWRPFDTTEPAAPDRPSRLRRCALSLAWGRREERAVACPAIFPEFHHLARDCSPRQGAVKARRAVSSAAPAGRTNPTLVSLTAPGRALLTVAGDELRKDGGNEANRVPRADRTEQPKGWAPNLGIRCAV